jgi:hypothetical protein
LISNRTLSKASSNGEITKYRLNVALNRCSCSATSLLNATLGSSATLAAKTTALPNHRAKRGSTNPLSDILWYFFKSIKKEKKER